MLTLVRMVVTGIAWLATYFFVFWLPFSVLMPSGDRPQWIPNLGSLLCAMLVARYVWRHSASVSGSLATCVGMGALVVGAVGFVGGFFGPMVFAPDANQGPLLGLFITGPLGFLLGAVGGAIYWFARGRQGHSS